MRTGLACVLLPALSTVLGCGERLSPQSEVDKLRLLAIRADRPEVAPGETVQIEALWADPLGAGRTVGFGWAACALGPGANAEACGTDNSVVLGYGEGLDAVSVDVPADALPEGTVETSVIVTLFMCAGGLPEVNGNEVRCADESVTGYKRIVVSRRDAPNQNPAIAAVSIDARAWPETYDATLETCPTGDCAGVEIVLAPQPGSAEAYLAETPDGTTEAREELIVSFFATAGELGSVRAVDAQNERFSVAFRAPTEPGPFSVWFVLRDGRGGVTWIERAGEAL